MLLTTVLSGHSTLKTSPLKCVLCSLCLDFFPSWPFAILFLHSVLLKSSIYNLSLPKFLNYFPPLQLFLLGFSVTLSLVEQTMLFSLLTCAYMDTPTSKRLLHGSASPLHPLFSLNVKVIALAYVYFSTVASFQITVAAVCLKYFASEWFPGIISVCWAAVCGVAAYRGLSKYQPLCEAVQ